MLFFFNVAPVEKNFNRKVILPGSFNPLHYGHLRLLEVASRFVFLPCISTKREIKAKGIERKYFSGKVEMLYSSSM